MSDYHSMGGLDDDEADIVIQEGTEAVEKWTRRMLSKIGMLETRDSPALRRQIEDDHRKGQDVIAETKIEIRSAKQTPRVVQAEREFRDACTKFRDAYTDYASTGGSGAGVGLSEDSSNPYLADEVGAATSNGSQQSLTLLMESENVDELLEREKREDTMRLAQDTAVLRDTMTDINELIEEGGEQLMDIEQEVETAATAAESAADELTKAREHQKATQKLKIIIGSICGCILLTVILIIVIKFASPPGSTVLNPVNGALSYLSVAQSTCETEDTCRYECSKLGFTTSLVSNTITFTPKSTSPPSTSTSCSAFVCPSATGTGNVATGTFSDGSTFKATPDSSSHTVAIENIFTVSGGSSATCTTTYTVSSGTVLNVKPA